MLMYAVVGGYMLMCATMDGKSMNSEIGCDHSADLAHPTPQELILVKWLSCQGYTSILKQVTVAN